MKRSPIRLLIVLGFIAVVVGGLILTTSSPIHQSKNSIDYQMPPINRAFTSPTVPSQNPIRSKPLPSKFTILPHPANAQPANGAAQPIAQNVQQTGQSIYNNIKQFQTQLANPSAGLISPSTSSIPSEQDRAVQEMMEQLGKGAKIKMNALTHTVRYLDGDLDKLVADSQEYIDARLKGDFEKMALVLADRMPKVLNIENPAKEFFAENISTDELGTTHVTLQQQYQGAPVWGAELGVHFNAQKKPYQISGVYAPTPQNLPEGDPVISEQQAIELAMKAIGQKGDGLKAPKAQRMVYWDMGNQTAMCWNVELLPNYAQAWEIFVSTADGSIVHRYNKVISANAKATAPDLLGNQRSFNCWESEGKYSAIDTTLPMYNPANSEPPNVNKLMGVILGLDFKNQDPRQQGASMTRIDSQSLTQWDPTCVTLMYYYPIIENYYRKTFNRNSIDNKGMNIEFNIHFTWPAGDQIGQTHNENACWNPSMNMMFFGDGDRTAGGKLAYDIDVVAHEYTHGVTGFEAGLIYETQSGALDEALSDFFGCMVDRKDWLLAEDTTPLGVENVGKIAMRDMSQPGNPKVTTPNPAVMAEYRSLPVDYDQGGVHINCGIPSYMMYLLAEGGAYAIGKEKTEQIVYRARNEYLTQRSQFIDFRLGMISAAKDIYGDGSAEMQACAKAADAVGITESTSTPTTPSTPGQVVQGDEMMLFLAANYWSGLDPVRNDSYYDLYLHGTDKTTGQYKYFQISQRVVASTRPAISGDGQWALYVDGYNNIVMTNGALEQNITNNSAVRTVAMNMSQRYVSFTTTNYDNNLYIIDLQEKDTTKAIKTVPLRVPLNSEEASTVDLSYADVMTFNFRGDYMIFDAVLKMPLASGGTKDAWGMYSLRLADLKCGIVMAPQSDAQFGNPIFSHTDDNLLLADLAAGEGEQTVYKTVSFNFAEKKIGILMSNSGILSRPTFRGDDRHVIFRTIDAQQQQFILVEGTLKDDKLSFVDGTLSALLPAPIELNHPVAFRSGTYVAQAGKISVPASLEFGTIPAGQATEKTLTITNSGNADLTVLSVSLEGTNADWFRHDGFNRLIPAGGQYQVAVQCLPIQEGNISGTLRIKSTDVNNPDVAVQLIGVSQSSGQTTPTNTPIPTATLAPSQPTPTPALATPTPTPTYTPLSQTSIEPIAQYEFDQIDLTSCGWKEVAGGFTGAAAGKVIANSFVGQRIPSSKDKVGLQISVQSKQVAFIHAANPVDTGGSPVLIRASVRADAAGAAVALAALKGNLATGEGLDGSIATNIPASAADLTAQEAQMTLVYEPDTSNWVTPVIQAASTQDGAVNLFIDILEVIKLDAATAYTGALFGAAIGAGGIAPQATNAQPAALYEFDQIDLPACGWTSIPGGFTGAAAGAVNANSFVGQTIPSSQDKVGIQFNVNKGEVAFIHAAAPIQTNGSPLLIRATLRSKNAGASVALAALKGTLATGADIDGSIATHIPASAATMVDGERTLTLVCPSNSAGFVTPILQVAGTGDQAAAVFVDRLDVYRLDSAGVYLGKMFYGKQ